MNKSNIAFNETETWFRFRTGEEIALGELAQLYYQTLYNYGGKFSKDKEFVKDCIQDLFLELWERRSFLGDTGSVKFYLLKSLRRKIHKESLKRKWIENTEELEFANDAVNDITIEQLIIANEVSREYIKKLNSLLSNLSKRQQEIIELRFYHKLENDEIMQIMSISRQAVANLLYRTLKEIKQLWFNDTVKILLVFLISFF